MPPVAARYLLFSRDPENIHARRVDSTFRIIIVQQRLRCSLSTLHTFFVGHGPTNLLNPPPHYSIRDNLPRPLSRAFWADSPLRYSVACLLVPPSPVPKDKKEEDAAASAPFEKNQQAISYEAKRMISVYARCEGDTTSPRLLFSHIEVRKPRCVLRGGAELAPLARLAIHNPRS